LVTAENQQEIPIMVAEMNFVFPHGVRGSLIPGSVGVSLLGSEDLDKAPAK